MGYGPIDEVTWAPGTTAKIKRPKAFLVQGHACPRASFGGKRVAQSPRISIRWRYAVAPSFSPHFPLEICSGCLRNPKPDRLLVVLESGDA